MTTLTPGAALDAIIGEARGEKQILQIKAHQNDNLR